MNPRLLSLLLTLPLMVMPVHAQEEEPNPVDAHVAGSEKLANAQDELAADVQQLGIEQTVPMVIQLLRECEQIMGDATERLGNADTGGETIAAQTEVIEKILAAAKARQQQGGGSAAGGAMMDMLERMAGKEPGEGEGKGNQPGDKPGEGQTGLSDSANTGEGGANDGGAVEERRIPKAAGTAGKGLPTEFQEALDAYNRGAGTLAR
jgi:hypothetical protein